MTIEEFTDKFTSGWKVKCSSVEERYEVLRFLADQGFILGPVTVAHLYTPLALQNIEHLNPGYQKRSDYNVSCWTNFGLGENWLSYDEVAPLIFSNGAEPESISETEFSAALSALFGGESA